MNDNQTATNLALALIKLLEAHEALIQNKQAYQNVGGQGTYVPLVPDAEQKWLDAAVAYEKAVQASVGLSIGYLRSST